MSVHTGRIGTPPQKNRMHLGGDVLTPLLILLVLAIVVVWLVAMGVQQWNASVTPIASTGQGAYHDQRAGEWSIGAPALVMDARLVYDQRAGEWSVGVPSMVMGSRLLYDQRAGEWSVGALPFLLGQSALHNQRVGEWSTGQTQPISIPQMKLDIEWLNRLAQARAYGIR